MPNKETTIECVEKAVDVLEVFQSVSFAPLSVVEIMKRTELKRNSVDRILIVWRKRGYVVQNERGEWLLGAKLLRFAERYAEFCLQAMSKK